MASLVIVILAVLVLTQYNRITYTQTDADKRFTLETIVDVSNKIADE